MSFLNDKITFGYIQDYTDPSNEPLGMSGNVVKSKYNIEDEAGKNIK